MALVFRGSGGGGGAARKGLRNRVVRCPKCGHPGTLSYKGVRRPGGRVDWYLVVDHRPFGLKTIHTIRKVAGPPDRRALRREDLLERQGGGGGGEGRGGGGARGRGFFSAVFRLR
ncbi:MAG: hypothetical protein QXI55_05885 [Thermofilum sp.]